MYRELLSKAEIQENMDMYVFILLCDPAISFFFDIVALFILNQREKKEVYISSYLVELWLLICVKWQLVGTLPATHFCLPRVRKSVYIMIKMLACILLVLWSLLPSFSDSSSSRRLTEAEGRQYSFGFSSFLQPEARYLALSAGRYPCDMTWRKALITWLQHV